MRSALHEPECFGSFGGWEILYGADGLDVPFLIKLGSLSEESILESGVSKVR